MRDVAVIKEKHTSKKNYFGKRRKKLVAKQIFFKDNFRLVRKNINVDIFFRYGQFVVRLA